MAHKGKRLVEAVAYMRTSSSTNVGADKNSEKRQRAAIESYAKVAGFVVVDWFYDAAVRGSDWSQRALASRRCWIASPATACARCW